jgi:hypothetical protein
MRSIIGSESNKIKIDGKSSIEAIDIVAPDNKDGIDTVVFGSDTPLLNLPTIMQEKHIGVYNAGIGNYIQKFNNIRTFFVYPTHNTTKFPSTVKKMLIYAINSGAFSSTVNTYKENSGVVSIITESNKNLRDLGESDIMNSGVGFRKTEARTMMKKPIVMTDEGPVGIRAKINTEIISKDREDNLNYTPRASSTIGQNKFKEYSELNAIVGTNTEIIWRNPDISLVYPSMPCKIVTYNNKKRIELEGVIQSVYFTSEGQVRTGSSQNESTLYNGVCVLGIYLQSYHDKIQGV